MKTYIIVIIVQAMRFNGSKGGTGQEGRDG